MFPLAAKGGGGIVDEAKQQHAVAMALRAFIRRNEELEAENARLREALEKIRNWCGTNPNEMQSIASTALQGEKE